MFRPQVQQPNFIDKGFDPPVETGPTISGDLSLQGGVDLMFGFGPKLAGNEILGSRPHPPADVVARDDEIGPALIHPANQQMNMGVIRGPVVDRHAPGCAAEE